MYGLGVAIALYQQQPFQPSIFVCGQIVVTAIQLMTHYANDYFDLEADQANHHRTHWSGGSGVLVTHILRPRIALVTALFFGMVASCATVVLIFVLHTGALTLPLILTSLLLAWFYSAPPIRLHSSGLGEASVALIVPILTPLLGYYLQVGALSTLPFVAALPLALVQFAMLLVIEFPDAESDSAVGKRTLVVRLGEQKAAILHNIVLMLAYALLPLLLWAGLAHQVALVILMGLPLAARQFWRMARGAWRNPANWNSLGFNAIVLLMSTALFELLVFMGLAG